MSRHPDVKWAEREDKVFLTVLLPDAKNPKVSVDPNGTFTFSATAGTDNNVYELKLDLLDKINEERSRSQKRKLMVQHQENLRRAEQKPCKVHEHV